MARYGSDKQLNTRNTHKSGKGKSKAKTPEQQFADLYAKIQRFEQQNEKLRTKIAELYEQYKQHVASEELAVCEARHQETLRLISFIPRKTLANWQKKILIDWVFGNIQELHANPFSGDIDITELEKTLNEALNSTFPEIVEMLANDEQEAESKNATSPSDSEYEETTDYQDDLFGADYDDDFAENDMDTEAFDDFTFEEFERRFEQYQEEYEQELKDQQSKLNKLFKSTTVSKMFRQLSKHFHPDLEQNELAKTEKHKKMSELLEARRNHDVLAIISLHTAVFGSSDEQFATEDIKQLIPLLKHQLKQLQEQKDDIIFEDPIRGTIYQQFKAKSVKNSLKKMHERKTVLQRETQTLRERAKHITSIVKLKPFLEERYDDHLLNMMFDKVSAEDFEDIPF